jgi:hypothetical protein
MNSIRSWSRLAALAGVAVALAGCVHGRVQSYADQVEARFMGEPAARALQELGAPKYESRIADLRAYVWQTGVHNEPGGNCRLQLVADPSGKVVDYTIEGTPLGCGRILKS